LIAITLRRRAAAISPPIIFAISLIIDVTLILTDEYTRFRRHYSSPPHF
jgi:hypothetical protein